MRKKVAPMHASPPPDPKPLVPAWPIHGMPRVDFMLMLRANVEVTFNQAVDEFRKRPASAFGWVRLESAMYAYQAVAQFSVETRQDRPDEEQLIISLAAAPIGKWVSMLNEYVRGKLGDEGSTEGPL